MKIAIAHYGEDVPSDDGYRPLRYGQLARRWVATGHDVIRISPSFSHLRRQQRDKSIMHTDEGAVRIVRTPGYTNSRGIRRAWFLMVWVVRSALEMRRIDSDVDRFLVGHPPPGTLALYRLFGGRRPAVVDIRDSWFGSASSLGRLVARAARLELRFADATTALSADVAAWTRPTASPIVAPIGVEVESVDRPTPEGPMRSVFIGSLNDRFTIEEWIAAWPEGAGLWDIYGAGPLSNDVAAAALECPYATYRGWVEPARVPSTLADYDVGVAPTAPGFGTNVSNKVAEYLAAGLFVVHSLNEEPAAMLAERGFGRRASTDQLGSVLVETANDIEALRSARHARQEAAGAIMGWDAIADQLLEVLRTAQ